MPGRVMVVICALLSTGRCSWYFPRGFEFGAASAAYQTEGAWNVSDKTECVWDRITHTNPELIEDRSTGDVACNSYYLWREDIQIASDLGVKFYRFSISWPRLLPTGFPDKISADGRRYYDNLINGLLERGIKPVVTLYHGELPQSLQDYGGWNNPWVTNWFAMYARTVYSLFGDRVKTWVTINEPLMFCQLTQSSVGAPSDKARDNTDPVSEALVCSKYMLLAHARAWRVYDEEFRHKYHGRVGMTNMVMWYEGETAADEEIANLVMEYGLDMYLHPIFSHTGGWPPRLERAIAEISRAEGCPHSKLPMFTREEIQLLKGAYDYLGLNYYTARLVRKARPGEKVGAWPLAGAPLLQAVLPAPPCSKPTTVDWLHIYPEGLRNALNWITNKYGKVEILILENGYGSKHRELADNDRVRNIEQHLQQVLLAIKDGVNVTGYTAWSLLDVFEWTSGYTVKFGLYDVDFNNPLRPRVPRKSAYYYASIIRSHRLTESRLPPPPPVDSNQLMAQVQELLKSLFKRVFY